MIFLFLRSQFSYRRFLSLLTYHGKLISKQNFIKITSSIPLQVLYTHEIYKSVKPFHNIENYTLAPTFCIIFILERINVVLFTSSLIPPMLQHPKTSQKNKLPVIINISYEKEISERYIDFNISQFFETYFYEQTKTNYIYHVYNLAHQQYFDDFSETANGFIFGRLFPILTRINHKNMQLNMHETLAMSCHVIKFLKEDKPLL